jgi:hypothetical protein
MEYIIYTDIAVAQDLFKMVLRNKIRMWVVKWRYLLKVIKNKIKKVKKMWKNNCKTKIKEDRL